jgi:hypothetical protein
MIAGGRAPAAGAAALAAAPPRAAAPPPPARRAAAAAAGCARSEQPAGRAAPFWRSLAVAAAAAATLAGAAATPPPARADNQDFTLSVEEPPEQQYYQTAPSSLDAADAARGPSAAALGKLLAGARGEEITKCTRRCVPTCVNSGQGAPGLGPFSMRRETGGVVLKDSFHSRKYCLSECVQICSIEPGGEK